MARVTEEKIILNVLKHLNEKGLPWNNSKFVIINDEVRYLLIKNKRSLNWGFPKGHMERGENEHETAYHEILEETGIRARFLPDFRFKSEYSIQGKIEKKFTLLFSRFCPRRKLRQNREKF